MEELTNVNTIIEIGKTLISVLSFIFAYIALRKSGKSPSESITTASEIAEKAKIYGEEKAQKYFVKQCKKHHIDFNQINNEKLKGGETSEVSQS